MTEKTNGNCFICGATLSKTVMKNHILKQHGEEENGQECMLLKIEGASNKNYWLFVDIPAEKPLSALENFLLRIWLQCCGHMSEFYQGSSAGYGPNRQKLGNTRKLGQFAAGTTFFHDYDFGSTTETVITVIGRIRRKPQKDIVRLLARNIQPVFKCASCEKTAEFINTEEIYNSDNPFYCDECAEKLDIDIMLPITNSPRMGECAYDGEYDTFQFDPGKIMTQK